MPKRIVHFSNHDWDDESFEFQRQIIAALVVLGFDIICFVCTGRNETRRSRRPIVGVRVYTLNYRSRTRKGSALRRWIASIRVAFILTKYRVRNPILWFDHPALFSLGYAHADRAIVYNIMEQFSWPDETRDDFYFDELTIMAEADVVLADSETLTTHAHRLMSDLGRNENFTSPSNVSTINLSDTIIHTIINDNAEICAKEIAVLLNKVTADSKVDQKPTEKPLYQ